MTLPFDDISFRPVVILLCGMLLFNLPIFLYKVRMFMNSVLYICFCYDKSYSKPKTDPSTYFHHSNTTGTADTGTGSNGIRRKTIYFVRHGESTWNDTFNKGKHRTVLVFILGFVPNLIKAILYELYLLLSGKMDRSVFSVFVVSFFVVASQISLTKFTPVFMSLFLSTHDHPVGFMMLPCQYSACNR